VFARFRNKERDIQTDVVRVAPIRAAVDSAVRAAESELHGLNRRMTEVAAQASFLFGDGIESATEGDLKETERLRRMETFLSRGEVRSHYLNLQISILSEVKAKLDTLVLQQHRVSN
jgi:hypothetical protein